MASSIYFFLCPCAMQGLFFAHPTPLTCAVNFSTFSRPKKFAMVRFSLAASPKGGMAHNQSQI